MFFLQSGRESRAAAKHVGRTGLHGAGTAMPRPLWTRLHTRRHGAVHGLHRLSRQPADDQRSRQRRRALSAREYIAA